MTEAEPIITFSGTFEIKEVSKILREYGVKEDLLSECILDIINISKRSEGE